MSTIGPIGTVIKTSFATYHIVGAPAMSAGQLAGTEPGFDPDLMWVKKNNQGASMSFKGQAGVIEFRPVSNSSTSPIDPIFQLSLERDPRMEDGLTEAQKGELTLVLSAMWNLGKSASLQREACPSSESWSALSRTQ